MSGYTKGAALLSGMVLIFLTVGCCGPRPDKPVNETPAPVAEAPPPPTHVEPAPPPPPPPVYVTPPPQPVLPPAVTRSIEELSDKYPGLFTYDNNKGLLYFGADALFDSGSAVVKPDAKTALGKLATILNEEGAKDRRLTIIGYTDTDRVVKTATIRTLNKLGKSADNIGLSQVRSEAVAAVLEGGDVDASRMTTEGRGDAEPVADNRTPAGKARNRRVEIYVTPAKSGA
jgi:outer membrane protein OmpA-like peptidoglycan-associated protein